MTHVETVLLKKFISQIFQEHQIQQDRIADERNSVVKFAANRISKAIYHLTTLLILALMLLALSSCTRTYQACPVRIDPANCYEWALEHGTRPNILGECPPYSEKRKGRCYPI